MLIEKVVTTLAKKVGTATNTVDEMKGDVARTWSLASLWEIRKIYSEYTAQ